MRVIGGWLGPVVWRLAGAGCAGPAVRLHGGQCCRWCGGQWHRGSASGWISSTTCLTAAALQVSPAASMSGAVYISISAALTGAIVVVASLRQTGAGPGSLRPSMGMPGDLRATGDGFGAMRPSISVARAIRATGEGFSATRSGFRRAGRAYAPLARGSAMHTATQHPEHLRPGTGAVRFGRNR